MFLSTWKVHFHKSNCIHELIIIWTKFSLKLNCKIKLLDGAKVSILFLIFFCRKLLIWLEQWTLFSPLYFGFCFEWPLSSNFKLFGWRDKRNKSDSGLDVRKQFGTFLQSLSWGKVFNGVILSYKSTTTTHFSKYL